MAATLVAAPAEIEAGGSGESEIATVGGVIVTVAVAVWLGSAFELAVNVTVPPWGTCEGGI